MRWIDVKVALVIRLPSQVRELGIRRGPLEESALISVLRLRSLSHCMDSLAQELIDEIITHVPRKGMGATSLVVRRWRHPSQRRNFEFVLFRSDSVARWEIDIPQDPDGIPSYLRHVRFEHFPRRFEPGMLGRVLKIFTSMISMDIHGGRLPPPDGLTVPVSLGEFGQRVTRLTLLNITMGKPSTVIASFIFSFPNLKELVIANVPFLPDESPPIAPDIFQRGPLESLVVLGSVNLSYDYIPLWRFAPHRLSFGPSVKGADLLVGSPPCLNGGICPRGGEGEVEKENMRHDREVWERAGAGR